MSSIEIFLFLVATPVLVIVAIGMVIIAMKTKKIEETSASQFNKTTEIDKATKAHLIEESKRHEYKQKKFEEIDNKIEELPSTITEKVKEPIGKIYDKIELLGMAATIANLKVILTKIVGESKFGEYAEGAFYFGNVVSDIKITYMIKFSKDKRNLILQSFSHFFEDIPIEGMQKLLEYNADFLVGTIGIKDFNGKKVIMIDETIDLPGLRMSEESIGRTLAFLTNIHAEIFAQKKFVKISFVEIIFTDYLKLSLGEEKYNELIDNGSDKQIENNSSESDEKKENN